MQCVNLLFFFKFIYACGCTKRGYEENTGVAFELISTQSIYTFIYTNMYLLIYVYIIYIYIYIYTCNLFVIDIL